MTIAEYFRDQGLHSLVILDDLSTHAKYYREISLLAKRFPGRGSYPGDIFYTHSSLLERAGNFKHPTVKEVSISCLPVMEIIDGDLTGYISTNVMGITDGHIYLDSNIYYQGLRPAINVPISVTRVGRQTLDKLSRDVNKILTAFLSQYAKLQNVSHFGQELSDDVKKTLRLGDLMTKFFNQHYQVIIPKPVQLIITSMILQNMVDNKEHLDRLKKGLTAAYYDRGKQKLLYELTSAGDMKEFETLIQKDKESLLALIPPIEPIAQKPAPPSPNPTPQQPIQNGATSDQTTSGTTQQQIPQTNTAAQPQQHVASTTPPEIPANPSS